jgi:hypothetical protein
MEMVIENCGLKLMTQLIKEQLLQEGDHLRELMQHYLWEQGTGEVAVLVLTGSSDHNSSSHRRKKMELISSASIAAKPDLKHQNVDLRIKVRTLVRDKL